MEYSDKIYVAGHTGMVGSAIVRCLQEKGYKNLVLRTSKELDLRNQSAVEDFFQQERPKYVFMAAARVGGIKENSTYPVEFLMDNLMIQNNIFQNAFKVGIKKLLFLGSACIFPKECSQPIKEDMLLTGLPEKTNEPYAIAKISGMRACSYYNQEFGTEYIGVTPANSYGVGDCFDLEKSHVIPALIRKCYEARKNNRNEIVLWGTGTPKREFIYVDDLASACVFLMNHKFCDDNFNIGNGSEISIKELVELVSEVVGYSGKIIWDQTKPDGMMRRIVDATKIQKLGWKAQYDMKEGLEKTYKWFLSLEERNES